MVGITLEQSITFRVGEQRSLSFSLFLLRVGFPVNRGVFSFAFAGLRGVREKRPLPRVETHCVEHARRLLRDRIPTCYFAFHLREVALNYQSVSIDPFK